MPDFMAAFIKRGRQQEAPSRLEPYLERAGPLVSMRPVGTQRSTPQPPSGGSGRSWNERQLREELGEIWRIQAAARRQRRRLEILTMVAATVLTIAAILAFVALI